MDLQFVPTNPTIVGSQNSVENGDQGDRPTEKAGQDGLPSSFAKDGPRVLALKLQTTEINLEKGINTGGLV